jgi:hypothetical protein
LPIIAITVQLIFQGFVAAAPTNTSSFAPHPTHSGETFVEGKRPGKGKLILFPKLGKCFHQWNHMVVKEPNLTFEPSFGQRNPQLQDNRQFFLALSAGETHYGMPCCFGSADVVGIALDVRRMPLNC